MYVYINIYIKICTFIYIDILIRVDTLKVTNPKPETPNPKPDAWTRKWTPESRNLSLNLETRNTPPKMQNHGVCTLHRTTYTLPKPETTTPLPQLYILHITLSTLNPAPCTLHPTPITPSPPPNLQKIALQPQPTKLSPPKALPPDIKPHTPHPQPQPSNTLNFKP